MKEFVVLKTKQRPLERTSSVVLVHFLWHKFEPNLIPGRGLAIVGREVSKSIPKVSTWRCQDSWRQSDSWNGFKRHLQLTLLTLPSSTIAPNEQTHKELGWKWSWGKKFHSLYSNQLPHSLTQTNLYRLLYKRKLSRFKCRLGPKWDQMNFNRKSIGNWEPWSWKNTQFKWWWVLTKLNQQCID